jgi:hypothetical protein
VILMEKQQTFASAAWSHQRKVTRRERFLGEMDAVIPWSRIVKLIEPHYHLGKTGRQTLDFDRSRTEPAARGGMRRASLASRLDEETRPNHRCEATVGARIA